MDILIPKPLETTVVLDVHQIACGVHHVALVNRQGEVFTWGEESGGRLGHGIDKNITQPHLVEFLSVTNVDVVACGEYHTCAVSTLGDLYTWGDGIHHAGILGHDTDASHWIPKRVYGLLDGIQVLSIACGTWHSVIISTTGKVFTFGDGKFGVLGHGDRKTVLSPKEVQKLSGMRTVKIACGVWHTAAIVEVTSPAGSNATMTSKKLFTWGDGDKYRLGHGNKETYLTPTCVSALTDYGFHHVVCGHTMTVALTTSGHIFTMGSNTYGQLGNPQAEGILPCLVQDKLVGEFVEEIACGAFHVAVLTSRSEVYTWGKGANGRLGHGDVEDCRSPTLVEALKDKIVKSIACGENMSSSICIHKWISGTDQSVCSGCRQAFGFTKKRHNCYNCGLVHCHGCSSKKALRAALAPTPGKPHRVCDACYNKLHSSGVGYVPHASRKGSPSRRPADSSRDKSDKDMMRSARILPPSTMESVRFHDGRSQKSGSRHGPTYQQMKDAAPASPSPVLVSSLGPIVTPLPVSSTSSRPSSPKARRSVSPSSSTALSRGVVDSLKKSNGVLSQEVTKLQNQLKTLRLKNKAQEDEIQKLLEDQAEVAGLGSEHSSKCREAKEVAESLSTQLKEIAETLPPDVRESDIFKAMRSQADSFLRGSEAEEDDSRPYLSEEDENGGSTVMEATTSEQDFNEDNDSDISRVRDAPQRGESVGQDNSEPPTTDNREAAPFDEGGANGERPLKKTKSNKPKEVTEQFEPGVYVTVLELPEGTKVFKRVRFSKRKFSEYHAEEWWKGNRERVMKSYSPTTLPIPTASSGPSEVGPPPPPIDQGNETVTPPAPTLRLQ